MNSFDEKDDLIAMAIANDESFITAATYVMSSYGLDPKAVNFNKSLADNVRRINAQKNSQEFEKEMAAVPSPVFGGHRSEVEWKTNIFTNILKHPILPESLSKEASYLVEDDVVEIHNSADAQAWAENWKANTDAGTAHEVKVKKARIVYRFPHPRIKHYALSAFFSIFSPIIPTMQLEKVFYEWQKDGLVPLAGITGRGASMASNIVRFLEFMEKNQADGFKTLEKVMSGISNRDLSPEVKKTQYVDRMMFLVSNFRGMQAKVASFFLALMGDSQSPVLDIHAFKHLLSEGIIQGTKFLTEEKRELLEAETVSHYTSALGEEKALALIDRYRKLWINLYNAKRELKECKVKMKTANSVQKKTLLITEIDRLNTKLIPRLQKSYDSLKAKVKKDKVGFRLLHSLSDVVPQNERAIKSQVDAYTMSKEAGRIYGSEALRELRESLGKYREYQAEAFPDPNTGEPSTDVHWDFYSDRYRVKSLHKRWRSHWSEEEMRSKMHSIFFESLFDEMALHDLVPQEALTYRENLALMRLHAKKESEDFAAKSQDPELQEQFQNVVPNEVPPQPLTYVPEQEMVEEEAPIESGAPNALPPDVDPVKPIVPPVPATDVSQFTAPKVRPASSDTCYWYKMAARKNKRTNKLPNKPKKIIIRKTVKPAYVPPEWRGKAKQNNSLGETMILQSEVPQPYQEQHHSMSYADSLVAGFIKKSELFEGDFVGNGLNNSGKAMEKVNNKPSTQPSVPVEPGSPADAKTKGERKYKNYTVVAEMMLSQVNGRNDSRVSGRSVTILRNNNDSSIAVVFPDKKKPEKQRFETVNDAVKFSRQFFNDNLNTAVAPWMDDGAPRANS